MGQPVTAGARHLGGDDDPGTAAALFQPAAYDGLRGALGFRPGGNRVHLRGVQEVDALVQGVIQLLVGFGFGILFAPGHGAQAERADADAAVSQWFVFHGWPDHFARSLKQCSSLRHFMKNIGILAKDGRGRSQMGRMLGRYHGMEQFDPVSCK